MVLGQQQYLFLGPRSIVWPDRFLRRFLQAARLSLILVKTQRRWFACAWPSRLRLPRNTKLALSNRLYLKTVNKIYRPITQLFSEGLGRGKSLLRARDNKLKSHVYMWEKPSWNWQEVCRLMLSPTKPVCCHLPLRRWKCRSGFV